MTYAKEKESIQKIQILPAAPEKDPAGLCGSRQYSASGGSYPDHSGMLRRKSQNRQLFCCKNHC